jgi:hypothetical protein
MYADPTPMPAAKLDRKAAVPFVVLIGGNRRWIGVHRRFHGFFSP